MASTTLAIRYAADCPCGHRAQSTITTEKSAAPNRIRVRCRECEIINYASQTGSKPVDTPEADA